VANTSWIGGFKLSTESSVAAGVRRIEAITGDGLDAYYKGKLALLDQISEKLNHPADLLKQLDQLIASQLKLSQQLETMEQHRLTRVKEELAQKIIEKNGTNILIQKLSGVQPAAAKDIAFQFKQICPSLFLVLVSEFEDKPGITVMISDDLIQKHQWSAGSLVREWGKLIKGGGGGQPFFAQAGGTDTSGMDDVLSAANGLIN
jgi:alanyl-tRNA synthetase